MRSRTDEAPPRPMMHIDPHTVQAMMAAQYAEGLSTPVKRPLRERLWFRAIVWFLALSILTVSGIFVYALILAKRLEEPKDSTTAAEIIEGATPLPVGSTLPLPDTVAVADTTRIVVADSPLLEARTPYAKTSHVQMLISETTPEGVGNSNTAVTLDVHNILDGESGWFTLSTFQNGRFTVAKYGTEISVQAPNGQWYQTALDESTKRLLWGFEMSAPGTLRDLVPPAERESSFLVEQGPSPDLDGVTLYTLDLPDSSSALGQSGEGGLDPDVHDEIETITVGFDRDGVMRVLELVSPVDQANNTRRRSTITMVEFGDTPVEFPALVDPLPLPAEILELLLPG